MQRPWGLRDGYPLCLPVSTWRVEYRKRHANRKLFSPNPGVINYRSEADIRPGVDQTRVKVDDHDHETNKKNRSYRRHVRNKYYKALRNTGQFNELLLPGKKKLNEPFAVNEAVYTDPDENPSVINNRRIWKEQAIPSLLRYNLFEKGDILRTKDGILSKIISLMIQRLYK